MDVADRDGPRLELHDRARAGARGPAGEVAPRQRLRRFELDQCHGLCPRPSVVLRRVGRRRRSRLELPRAPAALPAARRQLARRVGLSRDRWAAVGRRHDRPARRPSRVSRSGTDPWIRGAARVGLQWRPPGAGRGLLSEEHPPRSPAFGSGRLSRARPGTPQPHGVAEHAGAASAGRRTPRDGDRGAAQWCPRTRARDARGRALRRCDRLAEAVVALGDWPGCGHPATRPGGRCSICLASARTSTTTRARVCDGTLDSLSRRRRCRPASSPGRAGPPRRGRRTCSSMSAAGSTPRIRS